MASVQKGRISPPLPPPPHPQKKMGRGRPGKNTAQLHTREGEGEREAFWARGQEKNEEEEEEENSIPLKLSSNRTAHKRGRQGGGGRSEKIWEIGTDDSAPRPRGRKRQKKVCGREEECRLLRLSSRADFREIRTASFRLTVEGKPADET